MTQQIGAVSAIGCVGKIKAGAFHPDLGGEHAEVTIGITHAHRRSPSRLAYQHEPAMRRGSASCCTSLSK
jgi:hypothetical protein